MERREAGGEGGKKEIRGTKWAVFDLFFVCLLLIERVEGEGGGGKGEGEGGGGDEKHKDRTVSAKGGK